MLKNILNKIKEFDTAEDKEVRSSKLYGKAALYNTPNEITEAAAVVAGKGYKKFDIYTPYPLHGMDTAMGLPPPKIGYVSFIMGITGTILALVMMIWMSSIDYPNIIGGKPFFGLPGAIPITFESTVLLCGIATVLGLLILFSKMPKLNSPLNDTDFMKHVTSDKFGLVIETGDEMYIEDEVLNLFSKTNAYEVQDIYFRESNLTKKTPLFDKKFTMAIIITGLMTAGVAYVTLNYVLYETVPFNWMWQQGRIDAQSKSDFFPNQSGMRPPVEGTVARGFVPYEYQGMPDSVVKLLSNPVPVTVKSLERGQDRFNIYCSPCHGYTGDGDGRLRDQFPKPPSLHNEKVKNWPDGNIFHVMTNGQNVMPSYSEQVSKEDRWAIVNYIRALQRAKDASEEDLEKAK
ncbi:MAG TPA: DUF3341 domain-containing protein [Ignavibacteria bacterium]|nr:DUF3341 domain-containing protein [Ignavibacteria bacterium]HQY52074.1 DUF3341 domain-containing protein [Ignavibacteria bacterium]HRA99988.1 DUF3341 domain-containing protein [Ignavibacteria bacterium]